MNRWLWMLLVPVGWYVMMAMHELGHVVSVLINGGTIDRIILVPWKFSQTFSHGSSAPVVDLWAGAIVGSIFPLLIWLGTFGHSVRYYTGLFAGFCCIANGTYFGWGPFIEAGDTGELLASGVPLWQLSLFGILAIAVGLVVWHIELERRRTPADK